MFVMLSLHVTNRERKFYEKKPRVFGALMFRSLLFFIPQIGSLIKSFIGGQCGKGLQQGLPHGVKA